jgi:hypothetical protein
MPDELAQDVQRPYSIAAVGGVGQTMRQKQHPHGVDVSRGDEVAGSSRL